MDLLKQAFDNLERTVEKTVTEAALTVVESTSEFPDRNKQIAARPPPPVITGSGNHHMANALQHTRFWRAVGRPM
jgi:valyl-tRNA synthetase